MAVITGGADTVTDQPDAVAADPDAVDVSARHDRDRVAEVECKRVERLVGEAEAILAYVRDVRAAAPSVSALDIDAWADGR